MKINGQILRRNRFSRFTAPDKVECSEIINLYKDESNNIKVVPDFKSALDINDQNVYVFVHNIDIYRNIVVYQYTTHTFSFIDTNTNNSGNIYCAVWFDKISIQSFGKLIVITDIINFKRYYSIFDGTGYSEVKEFSYPVLNFTLYGDVYTAYDNNDNLELFDSNGYSTRWMDNYGYAGWSSGQINKVRNNGLYLRDYNGYHFGCFTAYIKQGTTQPDDVELWQFKEDYNFWLFDTYYKDRSKGYFYGFALVRIGLRMYDGSIAFVTTPKIVGTGIIDDSGGVGFNHPIFHAKWHLTADGQGSVFRYTTRYFATGAVYVDIELDLNTIDTKLFKGVVVLMSKPLDTYALNLKLTQDSGSGTYITTLEFKNQMSALYDNSYIDNAQYFVVKEIAIGSSSTISYTVDVDLNTIEQRERLEAGYLGQTLPIGNVQFTYNGRLYDGDLRFRMYSKHTKFNLEDVSGNTTKYIMLAEVVKDNKSYYIKGDSIYNDGGIGINSLLTYPDAMCKRLILVNGSMNNKYAEFALLQHSFEDFSYYLFTSDILYYDQPKKEAAGKWLSKTYTGSSYASPEVTEYIQDNNKLAISEINNPFLYKFTNLLDVGTGNILGIGAQSEPTSVGQFGQYPIVVVSTDGVYVLDISTSAEFAISRVINILNRKISKISNLINVGNTLFFADDFNINAVTGGRVVDFSKGVVRLDVKESNIELFTCNSFNKLTNDLGFDLSAFDRSSNLKIAYSKALDGIILNNILLQLNGFISRLDKKIVEVFTSGGESFVIFDNDTKKVYDVNYINETESFKNVCIISKPIFSGGGYSKVGELTLHGMTSLNQYNVLGLYASDDNVNYYPVCLSSAGNMIDISVRKASHSSKYWAFAYFGLASNEFAFYGLTLEFDFSVLSRS